ncbi:MAG: DNA adenine methylase [Bacteroidota bacterium]
MNTEPDNIIERPKKLKYKKVNAPFGYFGSKNKIGLQLCKNLPPHNCWVEAFCGSAALTLAKPPAQMEIINDLDHEIINFFTQLRDNTDELCRLVALTPYAAQELLNARINKGECSDLERARRFLVQAMMAINGAFGSDKGGFSCSQSYSRNGREARVNRWYNLPERLMDVVERLRDVRVENRDALTILEKFKNRPATLMYLDPPYLTKRVNGYKKDAKDETFHSKMLELANESKCMLFISGYDTELYNSFLTPKRGWLKQKIATSTKDSNGNSHPRTEVLWLNKHFQKAQKTSKVPIKLTDKERKENKINPERMG